jgi:3-oxoacyl-[acyl-carrier-protein] synthase II
MRFWKATKNMNGKRIVVTGMGLICPTGKTVTESWHNIRSGNSGIDWIKSIDTSTIAPKIAGEVPDYDPQAYFDRRAIKRTDRAQQFALIAAQEALDDSGLAITDDNTYDIGCMIGTGIGSIGTTVEAVNNFAERGQRGVRVHMVAPLLSDQVSTHVSAELGLRGPNYTIIAACSTGNNAIGDAADVIRLGRAKAVLAGGTEACLIETVLSGLANIKSLGYPDGDPTLVSRPFSADREGMVPGEGAGVLMLEDLDHALARGATIYAEITGYGHTNDAFHVTAPREDGAAAARAMRDAMREAGLAAEDIDYINAHGTGTVLNDKSETLAIKKALGETAYSIPVSSTKSMTGHMLGAAGAAEAVFGIMAIADNFAPPTINLNTPDPLCDLDYIPNEGRSLAINHVMSNAFGFGGHNAVIIMSRYADK